MIPVQESAQITFEVQYLHIELSLSSVYDINTQITVLWRAVLSLTLTSFTSLAIWRSQGLFKPSSKCHGRSKRELICTAALIILNWARRIICSPNKQKSPSENLFEPNVHLISICHCQQRLSSSQGNHTHNRL